MSATNKPNTWPEWKAKRSHWHPLWLRTVGWPEWQLERLLYWSRGVAIFDVLEILGRISVAIAVFSWFWEWNDRTKQSHYRAWELINSARGSSGDGGRRDALQDLNNDKVDLSAAFLSKAYLVGVNLPNATLREVDLSEADLRGANLYKADLFKAKMRGINLGAVPEYDLLPPDNGSGYFYTSSTDLKKSANLSKSKIYMADLTESSMEGTDFTDAYIIKSDLTGSNLQSATLVRLVLTHSELSYSNLTWANLSNAKFSFVDLEGVDFTGANLTGADFYISYLGDAKFCFTTMPDGTDNNDDCPPEVFPPKRKPVPGKRLPPQSE